MASALRNDFDAVKSLFQSDKSLIHSSFDGKSLLKVASKSYKIDAFSESGESDVTRLSTHWVNMANNYISKRFHHGTAILDDVISYLHFLCTYMVEFCKLAFLTIIVLRG